MRTLIALAACTLALAPTAQEQRPPNIVLIMADDLGWGELGCYGQELIQTPRIDSLAADGMRFTRFYSGSPVCAPSRCVLLTGMHTGHAIVRNNWEAGGWGPDEPEGQLPLPAGTRHMGTLLHDAGYATGAFGKWGLGGPDTSGAPERQGFDHFLGLLCQRVAHNYYPTHLWHNGRKLMLEGNAWFSAHQRIEEPLASDDEYHERFAAAQYAPDVMLEGALAFLRESAERPFLLYYPSPIPHVALQVPREDLDAYPAEWDEQPYLGQRSYLPHPSPRRAYAAMVSHLDREVGAILDALDELGLAEDTLVLFTSDNGPTFNGGSDSAFFDSAPNMRGLKVDVYEGGIKVPMLARWPGRIAAGSRSDHLSALWDLLPTVLEAAGQPPLEDIDGISLTPTLFDEGVQEHHEYLYWELGGQQALRFGDYKVVRRKLRQGDTSFQLYDLASDPLESHDLSAERPGLAARALALLEQARTPSADFPIEVLDG